MTAESSQVPVVKDWVVGWKKANVVANMRKRELIFVAIHRKGLNPVPYGVEAKAICQAVLPLGKYVTHSAPSFACRCGFNAFAEREEAQKYTRNDFAAVSNSLFLLRVGLKDFMYKGYFENLNNVPGFRAETQVVTDIFVSEGMCGAFGCQEPTYKLGVLSQDKPPAGLNLLNHRFLRPLCGAHSRKAHFALTLPEASAVLKVPFHWEGH